MKTPMQILLSKLEDGELTHINEVENLIKDVLLEIEKDHVKYFAFRFRHEEFTLKDIEKEYDSFYNYRTKTESR